MSRAVVLILLTLLVGPASAQPAGPTADGPPVGPVAGAAQRRFELGFAYGLAAFTERHGGSVWYENAPTGGTMDLETTPSLGAHLAWAVGENLRFGAGVTRQATRLVVTDETGAATRTDLVLLHVHVGLEKTFGAGRARPLLAVGGGGLHARAEDGSGDQWHYSAAVGFGVRFAVDPRVALRVQIRAPLLWANGDLVVQVEPSIGAAFLF